MFHRFIYYTLFFPILENIKIAFIHSVCKNTLFCIIQMYDRVLKHGHDSDTHLQGLSLNAGCVQSHLQESTLQ